MVNISIGSAIWGNSNCNVTSRIIARGTALGPVALQFSPKITLQPIRNMYITYKQAKNTLYLCANILQQNSSFAQTSYIESTQVKWK